MSSNSEEFCYFAYGLNIASMIKIPDLEYGRFDPDVTIRFGDLSDRFLDEAIKTPVIETQGCRVRVSDRAMSFDWPMIGKFLVLDGREVIVELAPEAIEDDLVPFLTGPAMIVLLLQRGYLVLHASSVLINGAAIAFIGSKGDGKSTIAASLNMRGHSLLSDDIVPVYFVDGKAFTLSGYPRIKLNPDSVGAVGRDPASLPYIHRFIEKHSLTTPANDSIAPVALDAIYILNQQEEIEIRELVQTQSFVELVANTHANRHLKRLNLQERHFELCRELVLTVPVFRLLRPHRFELINDVCSTVEAHLDELIDRTWSSNSE